MNRLQRHLPRTREIWNLYHKKHFCRNFKIRRNSGNPEKNWNSRFQNFEKIDLIILPNRSNRSNRKELLNRLDGFIGQRINRTSFKGYQGRCLQVFQNFSKVISLQIYHAKSLQIRHIEKFLPSHIRIFAANLLCKNTEPTFGDAHTLTSLVRGEEYLFLTILESHFAANLPHKSTTALGQAPRCYARPAPQEFHREARWSFDFCYFIIYRLTWKEEKSVAACLLLWLGGRPVGSGFFESFPVRKRRLSMKQGVLCM